MSTLTVQIFAENLMEVFEHYKRAFNAELLGTAKGSRNELIHLEMDIMGNKIAVAPHALHEIFKGNVTVICLVFADRAALMQAYTVLCEDGISDGLKELTWSPLEGYVTDKFGVVWCIGL